MVNLHLHTNFSDGVLSPKELLSELEKRNIKIASITDHDSVDAYFNLNKKNIKDFYSGILISGVEIKCIFKGKSIEILGYYVDVNVIKRYLDKNKKKINDFQKIAFKYGMNVCKEMNLKVDAYELKDGEWAAFTCYKLISKYYDDNIKILGKEIMENGVEFYYKTFCNPQSPFYLSEEKVVTSAKEAVDKIHEAGGLAFIAHIGRYKAVEDKIKFLEELYTQVGIDGVECYYPTFTAKERKKYIDFCHKYNLLISGGSDYHGRDRQDKFKLDYIERSEITWIK